MSNMLQSSLLIYFISCVGVLSRIVCPDTFHAAGEGAHNTFEFRKVLVPGIVHFTILRLTPARKMIFFYVMCILVWRSIRHTCTSGSGCLSGCILSTVAIYCPSCPGTRLAPAGTCLAHVWHMPGTCLAPA